MGARGGDAGGTMQRRDQLPTCLVSDMILLVGYCLFVMGTVSPAWRLEIGYTYGLWVRCDEGVCQYSFAGFRSYLAVVQSGMITSLLLLTTSTICVLLEGITRACGAHRRHVVRTKTMVIVTAAVGDILAAFSLGLYGCQTVMAMERLPVLASGFAVTGVGVLVSLAGNILKAMGPPRSWGEGMCCLAPRQRHLKNSSAHLYSPESDASPAGRGSRSCKKRQHDNERVGLISCFHDNKNGYSYSSVPSTISSSLDRGYRHYEEISFEDMPPPPLELLNQFPQAGPSFHYQHNVTPALPPHPPQTGPSFHYQHNLAPELPPHPTQEHTSHERNPNQTLSHSNASLPHRYFDSSRHYQQYMGDRSLTPDHTPERQDRQPGTTPQVAPRQSNQQRSVVRAARRHHHSATSEAQTVSPR